FKSFDDFISRISFQEVNKRAIEVLIKTGGFDKLDKNRATLILNYERAIQYEEKKRLGSDSGQVSLFEDAGIKEFADFKYEEVEEMPKMELLNIEKELIGCYVSGHPLDEWRHAIEKCATLTSENMERAGKEDKAEKAALEASGRKPWQMKNTGRSYVAIGMIQGLRQILTKKGTQMCFAKLADFKGAIDITFFPKVWEQLKDKIQDEGVYAFKGKVDGSRESPSLLVDTMEDPKALEEKSIAAVHIKMRDAFSSLKEISPLRDFLFGANGNCVVYFHISVNGSPFTVKANQQMQVPSTPDFIQSLKDQNLVEDVWCE
ncbi:MAG: DNA polymerase III subunit alpha, partial [Treponema sp.]|nr:DNA polymerase III subunit alpha [Treponema sp.]